MSRYWPATGQRLPPTSSGGIINKWCYIYSRYMRPLPVYTRVGSTNLLFSISAVSACLRTCLITCLPVSQFIPSIRLTVSFCLYQPIIAPSVCWPLSGSHSSVNLSFFISHLPVSPSVSTSLLRAGWAVCREKCLARVNGSAVNTGERFCCSPLSVRCRPVPFERTRSRLMSSSASWDDLA